MRAQLGAGRPKSLLQGIINSGVSQGHLVFIKRRQLNTVAALQCYNWKADWDVHREGPAPRHRRGMGWAVQCSALPCQPSRHAMDVKQRLGRETEGKRRDLPEASWSWLCACLALWVQTALCPCGSMAGIKALLLEAMLLLLIYQGLKGFPCQATAWGG